MHGDKFLIENEFPLVLQPGELKTVEVTFVPGEEGSFSDVLTLNSDINTDELVQRIAQQLKLIGHATEGQGIGNTNSTNIIAAPNPVGDKVSISFEEVQAQVNITVINYTGQTVLETSWKSTSSGSIDMRELQPGIYFVEIRSSEMEVLRVLKLLKN